MSKWAVLAGECQLNDSVKRGGRLRLEIKNNPTGRLLDILQLVSRIPDSTRCRDAWAQIFACDRNDTSALLNGMARLINLLNEAKEATMQHAPGDPTIYLAPFAQIEVMLSRVSLDQQWNTIKGHVNDKMISGLEFGDHMLGFKYGAAAFDQQEIDALLSGLAELLGDCLSSQLPENLKRLFAKNIEGLRSALISYRISGAEGIQDEVDRIGGAVYRYRGEVESAQQDPQTSAFMDRFFSLVGRINDSVQIVQNAHTIGASIMLMLSQIPK